MNLMELFVKIGVDDQASSKVSTISDKIGGGLKTAADIGVKAITVASGAIAGLTGLAIKNYAEYEQLVGHENQAGIQAGLNTDIENIDQTAVAHDVAIRVVELTIAVHEGIPQLLMVQAAAGQVRQQAAEGDADQQQGLELLDDSQVQQHAGDDQHHQVLPAACAKIGNDGGEAAVIPQGQKNFTNIDAHSSPP